MKRLTLLSLVVMLLMACSFSINDFLPPAASATPVPPTLTSTSNVPPTHTLTPTAIGARPSSTPTDTPPPSSTFLLVTLPTGTPVPTETTEVEPSATLTGLEGSGFESVLLSDVEFHWGSCTPNKTTMTVKVSNPAQVSSVVVFVRFRNKSTGGATGWDDGTAMENRTGGTFDLIFDGNLLGIYNTSWVAYQLVGTDNNNQEVARSPVFPEKLTISPCP